MNIVNWIRQAISTAISDSGKRQLITIDYNGRPDTCVGLTPYGMYSRAPDGSLVVVFPVNGGGDIKYGIAQKYDDRFKDLEPGEVMFGNTQTGEFMKFTSAGGIDVNGNLNVTGDLDVSGEITASDAVFGGVRFSTHVHAITGGSSAPGPTGVPQ